MAKKSLGQNFLVDERVAARIVRALAPRADETVIEVGPGRGALTTRLVEQAGRVVAIELDRELAQALRARFGADVSGCFTRTTSSSMAVCAARLRGQRKKTPDELMSRVTRVIGKSSGRPPMLRSRNGRRRLARGYSRCSGNTPTAWVGTRANRRAGFTGRSGVQADGEGVCQ